MNFKSILIILTTNFFTVITFAQEITVDDIDSISIRVAQDILKNYESKEVLIYSVGCIGCETDEQCDCYDGSIDTYLFWADNGSQYVKKINCCVNTYSIKTDLKELLDHYRDRRDSVFSSNFKTDYLEIHYVFNKIKSVQPDTILSKEIYQYYFNEDYKYRTHNVEQPAKHLITILQDNINRIEKEIGFTVEH